jgi:malonyl-CoA decarboxylase
MLARRRDARGVRSIANLCRDLLSERGEASGVALAREVVESYDAMDEAQRLAFFGLLAEEFAAPLEPILEAARALLAAPESGRVLALRRAVESPRQELIRRINLAPEGTGAIVAIREDLLRALSDDAGLAAVDADFEHVLRSWFNRGFLELRRIDWHTPAAVLEKLIEHEAVHEIRGWPDMRRRLEDDRRCFAFFHPSLPDEPLIFLEVALVDHLAGSIDSLLELATPTDRAAAADTAIFYSISNCQEGLRGISFGSFLIKQVVFDLVREQPRLRTFATLSPLPGFRAWLAGLEPATLERAEREALAALAMRGWQRDAELAESLREPLSRLCARYLLTAKRGNEPLDAVARFHLGNGARIERLNWLADLSRKGLRQSAGIMVNYLYQPRRIERNHEAYVRHGRIAVSANVRALARGR